MTGLSDTHPAPHAGWALATSPYHAGEMEMQMRVGWRDRAEKTGRRVIRDFMTDQHRQFFAMLPYVLIGSLDAKRRPWASVLTAAPGFVSSSDPRRLEVRARPLPTDPAWSNLHVGCPIGLVGIEMHTRRRNRLTGRVTDNTDEGFAISVNQSFGNCPQYIQSRVSTDAEPTQTNGKAIAMGAHLSPEAARIVTGADTLFIASASPQAGSDDPVEGVDCNHRGGKPGFVRLEETSRGTVLTLPDFSGNHAFNTFGNILLNPVAGLLFVDFVSGDLVSLTGGAEIIWEGAELASFTGAERLLRVCVSEAHHIRSALPLTWSGPEPAQQLVRTGAWPEPSNPKSLTQKLSRRGR